LPRKKIPIKTAWISARIPDYVEREIKKIVASEVYNDVSDYVRELIRKDFRERGITLEAELPEESEEGEATSARANNSAPDKLNSAER